MLGWSLLVVPEFLRIYLIMPFPGSQLADATDLAYFLHTCIFAFRIAGMLIIAIPFYHLLVDGKGWLRIITIIFSCIAIIIYYQATQVMQADKMFLELNSRSFADSKNNKVNPRQLVIGVELNNKAACYPVEVIAYHHKVQDTVGGIPLLVTYCSVCRSGRVYNPMVNGKFQKFRLVGMDQFNAMLEDADSRTWWRQENGEAVAGPLKGMRLEEIPSQQMTLQAWLSAHPHSLILQPDPDFTQEYASLEGFNDGTILNNLEGTSHSSWQSKSWVVGVVAGKQSRAYDWIELKNKILINDTLNSVPIVVAMGRDNISFHVWDRRVNGLVLNFEKNDSLPFFYDQLTNSTWNYSGECIAGDFAGSKLNMVPGYQEFWHSWRTFHPGTTQFQIQ